MNPLMAGLVVLFLIGLGVGLYFLLNKKEACKEFDTQDKCKAHCQWDTYGNKCIEEDDDLTPAPPAPPSNNNGSDSGSSRVSGAPSTITAAPSEGYTEFENFRVKKSTGGTCKKDANECYVSCNYDQTCTGYTFEDDKCCMLSDIQDMKYDDTMKVHVRTPEGYKAKTLGDRVGGLLAKYTDKNLAQCAAECDKKGGCVGISYKKGECELKKTVGLSSEYTNTGKQFLEKTTPKPTKDEVFHVTQYIYTRPTAAQKCESLGARLATSDEHTDAFEDGANWCSTGWDAEDNSAGYPINTSLVGGCSTTPRLVRWTPNDGRAGATCYGLKPGPGVDNHVVWWNASKYSKYD